MPEKTHVSTCNPGFSGVDGSIYDVTVLCSPGMAADNTVACFLNAGECWHKKSDFKSHLFETYKMAKLWGQDDVLCKCALMHSAYSNR